MARLIDRLPSPVRVAFGGLSDEQIRTKRERIARLETIEKVARNVALSAIAIAVISQSVGFCYAGGLRGALLVSALPIALFEDLVRLIAHTLQLNVMAGSVTLRSLDYVLNAASLQPILTLDITIAAMVGGFIASNVSMVANKMIHRENAFPVSNKGA